MNIELSVIHPGDTIHYHTYLYGKIVGEGRGTVHSISPQAPGSSVIRVYIKRPGKLYRGTVTGIDPSHIFEHIPSTRDKQQ